MAGTPEEMAKKFEEQFVVKKMQHEMPMAQQQSISELKNMVALLLEKPRKKKTRASPQKPGSSPSQLSKAKGNGKEGEHFTFEDTKSEENCEDKLPQSSSEEEESSEYEVDPHLRKMK